MLKSDLQIELQEAFELNDLERLALLETKWVHRFGLETFPKFILKGETSPEEDLSLKHYSSTKDYGLCELVDELIDSEETNLDSEDNLLIHSEGFEKNTGKSVDVVLQPKPRPINIAPPPPPALSHLRKWVPKKQSDDHAAS